MTDTADHTADDAARPEAVEASRRSAGAVGDVTARFMLDMDMYAEAAELGYEGLAFYVAGRGGVLGDVEHTEVVEAFTFFPADTVQTSWESAESVESRRESAERFADYAAKWATANIADGDDTPAGLDRLAELCGKVIDAADGSAAPVFAGWRALPEPDGERELVVHRMNGLRELRAARHGAAVRAVGLEPVDAFMVRTPYMAGIFGWPAPEEPPGEDIQALWARAEELTDELFGRDLAVLSDAELDEFCDLASGLHAAVS